MATSSEVAKEAAATPARSLTPLRDILAERMMIALVRGEGVALAVANDPAVLTRIAAMSYGMADAMLDQRSKQNGAT